MTTTNYAIVIVMDNKEDNGYNTHYTEVRTYEYLDDAKYDMKYDAVEVYKDAEYELNGKYEGRLATDKRPYHLEVVKLRWSGNYSEIARSYSR